MHTRSRTCGASCSVLPVVVSSWAARRVCVAVSGFGWTVGGAVALSAVACEVRMSLELIRLFVWRCVAAVDRVAPIGARGTADLCAAAGAALWAVALTDELQPVTTLLLVVFGPYLASLYLADRRLASDVARSRTGLETTRDYRVELSLTSSERILAFEVAVLPLALLSTTTSLAISSIILVKVASIAVHADLGPRRSVWSATRKRVAALFDATGPVPAAI